MGQNEIIKLLKQNKDKWYTPQQMSLLLNVTDGSIQSALNKMLMDVNRRTYCRQNAKGNTTKGYEYSYMEDKE